MDNFELVLKRLYETTEIKSQRQLSDVLKIRPPSITDAKKRGVVPPEWVVKLSLYYNLSPAWILSGKKPVHIELNNTNSLTHDSSPPLNSTLEKRGCKHEYHCSKIENMPMGQELLSDFFGLVDGNPREFTIAMAEIFKLADAIRRKNNASVIVNKRGSKEVKSLPNATDSNSLDYFSFLAGFELKDSRFFQNLQPAIENADFSMIDICPMAIGVVSVEEQTLLYSNQAALNLSGFSIEEARQYFAKSLVKVELIDRPHKFLRLNGIHFSPKKQPVDLDIYLGKMYLQGKTEVIVVVLKPLGVSLYDVQN